MDRPDSPVYAYMRSMLTILIVFAITCLLFVFYFRRRSYKRGVLLTGLCDSGKTLTFSQLVHGKYVNTQTSMKENVGEYIVKSGSVRVIDIPGHERLRDRFFDQYKSAALGVIYMLDSATVQKDIRDTAEYLYNILSECITSSISSVLIICNKQDLDLSKTSTIIKSMLEKELNAVRLTKGSQLESVDPKGQKTKYLGKKGTDFGFSQLPCNVQFVEASISSDSKNIEDIEMWLAKLCS
ncbi:hypothetical protein PPYR_12314 [Photinus pyralis]|uniref:Signal recognition particle receptor subunit beta n=1 Tax=Photinus pyralis TaxID=7054 RepID=A0A1Y1LVG5_PHOPY|nr:signal recognition particle receptor subunit beta [Photinus pyralis]KAB0795475.1 hypothetical protein PPYR_12314 [Photinus pyralis]